MQVSNSARQLLRTLAKRVAEIAAEPVQVQRRREWFRHNALRQGKPLVCCFPEDGWTELLPDSTLQTSDPLLRSWEKLGPDRPAVDTRTPAATCTSQTDMRH